MLVTFEGIDNCGKTTQIGILANSLTAMGYDVLSLREPGGTSMSEEIRSLLLNSKSEISPATELLLFNSARCELVSKVIKPALNSNRIVILDRFYDSTTAYQGFGRGIDIDLVKRINLFATQGLSPNITFYIKLSLADSLNRNNTNERDRIESSGNEFYERVIDGFDQIANDEKNRFIIIDGTESIEMISKFILEEVIRRIKS